MSRHGALVFSAALLSATARAEEGGPNLVPLAAALRVEPNACFEASSLAPAIARWLQRDAIDRRLIVEVSGQADDAEGLLIRIRRDGQLVGERRFSGRFVSCEEVRTAVALAAALAVDATVVESLGVHPRAPGPEPAAPKVPEAPVGARRTGVSASLDAAALFGVLPSPVPAFAPAIGVRPAPPVELRLSGLFTGAGAMALDRYRVDAGLLAARADVCAAFAVGFARTRVCAGLAAGRLQATASGPMVALAPSAPWAAAVGRVDVRVSLRPWFGIVLGGDALFPMTRPRFLVQTVGGAQVAASGLPAIGGAVSLGPEITFR